MPVLLPCTNATALPGAESFGSASISYECQASAFNCSETSCGLLVSRQAWDCAAIERARLLRPATIEQ